MLRRTQKERGMIISEKEDKLARESRKKKMDWISLLIVRNSSHKE